MFACSLCASSPAWWTYCGSGVFCLQGRSISIRCVPKTVQNVQYKAQDMHPMFYLLRPSSPAGHGRREHVLPAQVRLQLGRAGGEVRRRGGPGQIPGEARVHLQPALDLGGCRRRRGHACPGGERAFFFGDGKVLDYYFIFLCAVSASRKRETVFGKGGCWIHSFCCLFLCRIFVFFFFLWCCIWVMEGERPVRFLRGRCFDSLLLFFAAFCCCLEWWCVWLAETRGRCRCGRSILKLRLAPGDCFLRKGEFDYLLLFLAFLCSCYMVSGSIMISPG